ncbi:MAG: nicotinate (nicotinamide) nucleotide adenylyltransferase, partial [Chloroflexota bacterium]
MRRIGLLGGTFNPPHIGHLWLGETAFDQLKLDEIWFLPVGDPPHKSEQTITAVSHRLHMTHLAIQDRPHFVLKETDATREPPHSTISLLKLLHEQNHNSQFWLLIGGDSLRDFHKWIAPQEILKHCRIGALPRPGSKINWETLNTAVPTLKAKIDWLDGPTVDISRFANLERTIGHMQAANESELAVFVA